MDYDYIIIGSGFGGSVSALRLAEKGYRVLVIEQGKWYRAEDFPRTNWQLSRFLWVPALRWFGIMKITIFRHVGFISGTGVGGGSLVYANTLPVPKSAFFRSGNWKGLADWEAELAPHYETARRMLGAAPNPQFFDNDRALEQLAEEIGQRKHFGPTNVSVYFGAPGQTVADPYFGGQGPERTGCIFCGSCMTGCRHDAKNTLDKNYLYLAQRHGAEILAEHRVVDVRPLGAADGSEGYEVYFKSSTRPFARKKRLTARGIVFAGGVLGTVGLLLRLKRRSLPRLSERVGCDVRTNNESLIMVTQLEGDADLSRGVAIGSILHTDEHSHLEVCRYGAGSGAWRLSVLPYVTGSNALVRLWRIVAEVARHPRAWWRYLRVPDWAKKTTVLLFMQTLDSTVTFRLSRWGGMRTEVVGQQKPTAFIPRATELARRMERILNGKATAFFLTPLAGIPGTAHILGGAVMGDSSQTGVIDRYNRVFGYQNMYVCDGAAVSANPGVNPSLTITAIAERAISRIPPKDQQNAQSAEPISTTTRSPLSATDIKL
ncbi:MAG: GMC family oxidoreductase [Saprospiraceae bacterium]|nr:GMC family oxidoreductase [Saprospiraceae bacterium]MDW8230047.1 GMC family oxidoreductase [Saprospiraceae bacterium]